MSARTNIIITSALGIWLALSSSGAAQTTNQATEVPQELTTELWQTIQLSYQATVNTVEQQSSLYQASKLLGRTCPKEFLPSDELSTYLAEESDYWDESYGLQLRGGLTTGDIEESQFDAGGTTYLELSWDVFGMGYLENQYKAKRFARLSEIEALKVELEEQVNHFRCRDAIISSSFSRPEFTLSAELLSVMELVYAIEERAYLTGNSALDELFVSEESLLKLRQKLKMLNVLQGTSLPSFDNPPLIDIDISKILQLSENDARLEKLAALEIENVAETNPYQNNSRLRLFVRKELDVLASQQDDLVAGLRFIYPLDFGERGDETRKVNVLSNELKLQHWEKNTRIKEAYLSFQQQLERAITESYRYLRAKERMRRSLAKHELGRNLQLSAVMARLKTFIEAAIEMVEVKKSVYQRANQVFLTARVDYSPELITEHPVSVTKNRARFGERSTYIWSDTLNAISNEKLLLLLETKGIENVAVSASSRADSVKLDGFLQLAEKKGIMTSLLIGDPTWVKDAKRSGALNTIDEAGSKHPFIHLDVEPHTLNDYKERPEAYQRQLVSLITDVTENDPTLSISVSLPFHYKTETYQSISQHVDAMYIMMYENTSVDTAVRRIIRILNEVPLEKVVVALRLADFESEYLMERFIRELGQATGVQRFAVHPVNAFITEGELQ